MKHSLIVLCAAVLASPAVMANDEESHAKESNDLFKTVDADSDGKVSKEEAAANPSFQKNFDALDGNHDGTVTEREYRRNTMSRKDH